MISIAVVCCFLEPVVHEAIGHGLAAVVLGAHFQHVSSVDMAADASRIPRWAGRAISSAGIISNLAFGLAGLLLLRQLRSATANVRYFLWLFGHANLFVGSGYMLATTLDERGRHVARRAQLGADLRSS